MSSARRRLHPRPRRVARRTGAATVRAMTEIEPVRIGRGVVCGGAKPMLIMGPCVIESERHALKMAGLVAAAGKRVGWPTVFKASFDKANRTSHASFRGQGMEEGLRILARVRAETGLPVTTDVHESAQVERVAEVVDLLQVPALLCRQTDLVEACARSGRATSIKKGQFLAPWDCGNIVAKFRAVPAPKGAPKHRLILIERGTSFGYNTLVSDFRGLPIMRGFGVPVVFDGTHSVQAPGGMGSKSGGSGHFAPMMMRAALAVGCEGIFLETHDDPPRALSDGPNVVPTRELAGLLHDLRAIDRALGRPDPPKPRPG
jgi:2-dehydro-3-deoxyphosphooctonate aldolase (KDO 8-P synthase)